MPPGFGYSQNTSVADGNSIGVMNDEETASNLSEEGAALLPAEKASGKSAAPSNPSKRSLKLKNKVYFQLLELTNALQQSQAKKGGGEAIRLSSSMVMKLAQIVLGTKLTDAKAMNDCRRQLSELIPLIQKCSSEEFTQYVSQLRAALDKSCFSGSNV